MTENEETLPAFVELPTGIFTAEGVWFHTRRELLEEFAAGVMEQVSLEHLLRRASAWLRLPVTATVWLLPIFLILLDPWPAALGGVFTWAFLALISPFIVFPQYASAVGKLANPIAQGLLYVVILSFLAAHDNYAAVAVGISAFILLRWGVVDRLFRPLLSKLPTPGLDLPASDQVLRNMILRTALRRGIDLPELADMENRMLEIWHRHREFDSANGTD